ncbi:porin family protein [Bradyrhizobium sp. U87765 SZCCT0131]|uniref:outer membrane protein n=1 Tax=unclassified Bradyrhizobium TaxID=2631580 RepID=UPI001BA7E515|nr:MULTISPECIES: outer membrane beta-barrel protein [unclassified Bradyrhizobium]MBR1221878.1 porin family protein [Bradyrhizobium sp. U87765 SZCCT0131]MBR1263924.1 porin family protein [Bradyrhizobium sp. U87765 SZCCT0134]MBR1302506.1 porin family protein [Bradyrhizobium sp. U87765 SZCCT0110]MBR1320174.1 porin family protein [Bradyrhizobium sp. U87765 SZCCT0109]MBR1348713.1 porin family protein [Bradyrhizobium sp. U87765 SZCCT0048]
MRHLKHLLAATAASLLSTAALAADLPIAPPPAYAPPPPADFGGWYLRGDIGFSNQNVKNVRSTNDASYASVSSLNQTSNFDSAGIYGVGVGYQFNNWFRMDVTGQYRGSANFKGTDTFRYAAYGLSLPGSDAYSASKSELLFLANAYVDLGTWWCITPFIGAGVGTARVSVSNFSDTGDFFASNGTSVYQSHSYTTAANASKWNFAWAAHAGLAYRVNPSLTIELAYSYVDMGKGMTGPTNSFDQSSVVNGAPFVFKNITSNDVKLGVRWSLSPTPVYAPPPLITKG